MTTQTTANAVLLRDALIGLRDSLIWRMSTVDRLTPGGVVSALQDVCIEARLRPEDLPELLKAVRDDAVSRDRTLGVGRGIDFGVPGLVRTINDTLVTM